MSKGGKLSLSEKYIIKGMNSDGKSRTEIATELDRTEKVVSAYLDVELEKLATTIAKVQVSKSTKEETKKKVKEVEIYIPDEMYDEVVFKLSKEAGMPTGDAKDLVDRTIKHKLTGNPTSAQQLYTVCIRSLSTLDIMTTRTATGKKGVAIMNSAASSKGDASSEKARKNGKSRSARGAIYRPKEGTID